MAVTVLIVEDEEKIGRFLELELLHEGYEVLKAVNGREGLEKAQSGRADLVVLDVMLPELNGFEVLRRLRKNSDIPVIMLTARDEVMDKVAGLDGGADDYMTKPFAIEELLARIRLVLKKRGGVGMAGADGRDKNQLKVGKLCMDVQRYEVSYDGKQVVLTHREFELLKVLLENKNIVISRDTLLEKVCGYDYMGETNIIDVYVRYLRSKLDDVYQVKIIQTVRGVGYCIKDES
ncbi:MAG: response regulator transcription factor [Lachnospiraceae bacterium]|nr:response regulator transcription factor [Lachnospiraceae bacterium]